MYNPAIGSMWRTLLAVRNIRISFFKSLLTVFGKSTRSKNKYIRISNCLVWIPLILGCFRPDLCILGAGLALDSLFGKANIAKEASINRPDMSTKPIIDIRP